MMTQRYEYLACPLDSIDVIKLNDLGGKGWELVCTCPETDGSYASFFFKRPLPLQNGSPDNPWLMAGGGTSEAGDLQACIYCDGYHTGGCTKRPATGQLETLEDVAFAIAGMPTVLVQEVRKGVVNPLPGFESCGEYA